MSAEDEEVRDDEARGPVAEVGYTLYFDADDVVRGLRGDDDRIFMFIMRILEDERVGIEVRERLIEELSAPPENA